MAWRRPGDKPLSEPMMISLPSLPRLVLYMLYDTKDRSLINEIESEEKLDIEMSIAEQQKWSDGKLWSVAII